MNEGKKILMAAAMMVAGATVLAAEKPNVLFIAIDDLRPENNRVSMNAFWSVQSKGSLLTQKNKYHKDAAEMMVWLSEAGLGTPVEEDGFVFVEAEGAYAAVRVMRGGYSWHQDDFAIVEATGDRKTAPPGRAMYLEDEWSPVVVEVMAKDDVGSFDAFKARVRDCTARFEGPVLEYGTLYGDVLALDTSHERTPTVNGIPVDYAPEKVFESPFLNAEYNRGIVTISKDGRTKVLDFNRFRGLPHFPL